MSFSITFRVVFKCDKMKADRYFRGNIGKLGKLGMDVELQLTSLSIIFKSHLNSWIVSYFLCGDDTIYELAFKSILAKNVAYNHSNTF